MKISDIRMSGLFPAFLFGMMAWLSAGDIYAQIFRSSGIGAGWEQKIDEAKEKKKDDRPVRIRTSEELKSSNAWTDETRYFEDIRLDSLWYVGIGSPIPERIALKKEKVYRLSMRLENGRYIRVQCLADGKPHPSDRFGSHLLPVEVYDYDPEKARSWRDSETLITEICQYPSLDNKTKAIETAYDADGNVVRTASMEFPKPGQALTVYYDSKGNIVNLTSPLKYKNGTIVIADFDNGDVVYTVADVGGWPIVKVK